MDKFCKNCGDVVVSGEKFCDKCGKEISLSQGSKFSKTGVKFLDIRKTSRVVSIFVLIAILGVVSFGLIKSKPLNSERIFSESRPAVVRIGVRYGGNITVPKLKLDETNKRLFPTKEVEKYPIEKVFVGTGFIVNPKGYIVTNAHVVDTSSETIESEITKEFVWNKYLYLKNNLPANTEESVLGEIFEEIMSIYYEYGQVDDLTWQIAVFDPEQKNGTYEEYIDKGFQITDIKKVGDVNGKDLAIIKVDQSRIFPTVELNKSDSVKQGSRVCVIGYPVVADLSDDGNIEPTLTSGIVSAIKKSPLGDFNVIQIDAAISGGNSGGPALDEKGRVIGVTTFGATEEEGYNWILPTSLVREFLDELNVKY